MNYVRRRISAMAASTALAIATSAASSSAAAGGLLDIPFDENNFDDTATMNGAVVMTMISNPYWPLSPDATYVRTFTYLSGGEDECVINRILVDPTDTKSDFSAPYDKIHAQVVLDEEWVVELEEGEECSLAIEPEDEDLSERTLDWYAQDVYWNIWYMGEHSRSFEDDCPGPEVPDAEAPDECFEGSWQAGEYGPDMEVVGEPGIVVPSDTPTGDEMIENGTFYRQEFAEAAEDMAKILRQNAPLIVEDGILPGQYGNCRKVKEWTPLEPGASVEHKWYCSDGPGLVLVEEVGGGPTVTEVLVDTGMTPVD